MAIEADRAELHALVDAVPEDRLAEAKLSIKLLIVPDDDEPLSDEERESLDATHQAYLRGDLVPHDVAVRELGL